MYILYIKQNPTAYEETTISQRNNTLIAAFFLNLQQQTNLYLTTSSTLPLLFQKKEEKMVINRVLDYSDVYFSCLFFESFAKITVFLFKLIFFFILI